MAKGWPLPHTSATRSPSPMPSPASPPRSRADAVGQLVVGDRLVAADQRDVVTVVPVDDARHVHRLVAHRPMPRAAT